MVMKYCFITDEEIGLVQLGAGCSDEYYIEIGMQQRDVEQSEKDFEWYLKEKCPHYTPEEKEEMERERISHLKCTKRVLVLMLQELQYSWKNTIKPLIYANDDAALEWELCVELERKNPLLNQLGGQLGISSEQIDNLFKYANGEITQQEFLGE